MKVKKLKDTEKYKKIALGFLNKQKRFKEIQSEFEELKTKFYSNMVEFFEANDIESSFIFTDSFDENNLEVKKVQKSNVVFNADKLEKVLGKKISDNVIIKKYEIVDMFGLIAYLKECNVDPKIFKSFLSVTKSVDVKELERLDELGKISIEQLNGCYTVNKQKPYFTVGLKRWRGEND